MFRVAAFIVLLGYMPQVAHAQSLEQRLQSEPPSDLAAAAQQQGDAKRGAVIFYQPYLACRSCHLASGNAPQLGPDLGKMDRDTTDVQLVESVLQPSKVIKKGFEPVVMVTNDGVTVTGLLVKEDAKQITFRDPNKQGKVVTLQKSNIAQSKRGKTSIMPAGQVNLLASRQQFLDLVKYLIEIRDGGPSKVQELQPAPHLYAARPLPEYEKRIDHAGMLSDLNRDSYKRGEAIYNRLCINCHGTKDRPGSLPTSLKFAGGKFKNGYDPFTMYQTLTRGFGMMAPQTWMVPQQKYDVIHYVRETYLKPHNPAQFFEISKEYLSGLPKGDTRGPKPSKYTPWEQMDYGPNRVMTVEIGDDATNFAYKGNAIRLDAGPGGVSQGRYWMVFDYDTMRMAAAWSGKGFIDWNGIDFNGRHNIHPRVVGTVHVANPNGPGWARPSGEFEDVRLKGRDGRRYGPLPHKWAKYDGMSYNGSKTIMHYRIGDAKITEMPGVITTTPQPVFTRTFHVGTHGNELVLQVAKLTGDQPSRLVKHGNAVVLGSADATVKAEERGDATQFNGGTRLEVKNVKGLNLNSGDFTITANIKTKADGTILAQTDDRRDWVPNGWTWFIRGGRLTVDIGWVGAFQGRTRVADGKPHHVAVTYRPKTGDIQFFVDGKAEARTGRLKRKASLKKPVVRIGYTAADFPNRTFFRGEISSVNYFNAVLNADAIVELSRGQSERKPTAAWQLAESRNGRVPDAFGKHDGELIAGTASAEESQTTTGPIVAGVEGRVRGEWSVEDGNLRFHIPSSHGQAKFTLWFASVRNNDEVQPLLDAVVIPQAERDPTLLTSGGPARFPQELETTVQLGIDEGPFAVDFLTLPVNNPWFCRLRLTGLDFTNDGNDAIVSAWDGSIWRVSGLNGLPETSKDRKTAKIKWRRIASGLFQPLGVKIVDGLIYVTCRDQICILHDKNGDGEIDHFQNFNNDHQVTDHFHEFAMGLQTDAKGNFYYAKSARHALKALVPHHGTLLRVSRDGSKTEIVANGFRAANGVCVNPDGTFIVTDQEGHWNPKNRINWVREGGFYGNMFGYHDVTDSSDDAMEPPLCWITNAFDRSPAELLWVDSQKWGPLNGRLLNLSYGYGQIYVVPHEDIDGVKQGGMCALPIPRLPTGTIRGRFHPKDGQLYTCGMFAWAGSQTTPGGFYRIRHTGKPAHLPVELKAKKDGIAVAFTDPLDKASATNVKNYDVKVWSLKRTANYGSKHYNERKLEVTNAKVSPDGQTVTLNLPDLKPTWCMEIRYRVQSKAGQPVSGVIHNTVHRLEN